MTALLPCFRVDESWSKTHTIASSWVRLMLPSSGICLKFHFYLASSLFLNCFTPFLTRIFTNHLHTVHYIRTTFWRTQLRYTVVGYIHLKIWMKIPSYCDQNQCITIPRLSLPPTISVRCANILSYKHSRLHSQAQNFGVIINYFFT